jgi:hypothetical protein
MLRSRAHVLRAASAFRFVIPPGETSASVFEHALGRQSQARRRRRNSVSARAVRACGLEADSASPAPSVGDASGGAALATLAGEINVRDLSDEQVSRCLEVLPRYADLATAAVSEAGSLRSLARSRRRHATQLRREAVANLRLHISARGLCSHDEAQALPFAELGARFGDTPEVRTFLRRWRDAFVVGE